MEKRWENITYECGMWRDGELIGIKMYTANAEVEEINWGIFSFIEEGISIHLLWLVKSIEFCTHEHYTTFVFVDFFSNGLYYSVLIPCL